MQLQANVIDVKEPAQVFQYSGQFNWNMKHLICKFVFTAIKPHTFMNANINL